VKAIRDTAKRGGQRKGTMQIRVNNNRREKATGKVRNQRKKKLSEKPTIKGRRRRKCHSAEGTSPAGDSQRRIRVNTTKRKRQPENECRGGGKDSNGWKFHQFV